MFFAFLAVLAIGILWWGFREPPAEAEIPVVAESALEAPAPVPAASKPAVWVAPPPAGTPAPTPERHDEQAHQRELIAINEQAWTQEPASPVKAAEVEQKFQAAAASEGVTEVRYQPRSMSVQCRATLCRIESEFPTPGTSAEWALRMQLSLGGVIGNAVMVPQPLPGGGEKLVMYAYMPNRRPPG